MSNARLYHQDFDCDYWLGDVRDVAKEIKQSSVHTVVCSPPYWGLRDYGIAPSVWGGSAECEHDFSVKPITLAGKMGASVGVDKAGQDATRRDIQLDSVGSDANVEPSKQVISGQQVHYPVGEETAASREFGASSLVNRAIPIENAAHEIPQEYVGNVGDFGNQTLARNDTAFNQKVGQFPTPEIPTVRNVTDLRGLVMNGGIGAHEVTDEFATTLVETDESEVAIGADIAIGQHKSEEVGEARTPLAKIRPSDLIPGAMLNAPFIGTRPRTKGNGIVASVPSGTVDDSSAESTGNIAASSAVGPGQLPVVSHESSVCRKCGAVKCVLGLEKVPDCLAWARGEPPEACKVGCYICHMREVFQAIWRVLRDDGSCWINCGDSYSGAGYANNWNSSATIAEGGRRKHDRPNITGLKPKDRVGIPERLALALQADGWTWRDTIHLCKVAPMPESVRDRTTQAHEPLFLFTKKSRYFYDADAVREAYNPDSLSRYSTPMQELAINNRQPGRERDRENVSQSPNPLGRNPRSWMLWNPESSTVAHYATFPRFIPSFAIRAGSSEYGVCKTCLNPWERVTERESYPGKDTRTPGQHTPTGNGKLSGQKVQAWLDAHPTQTTGWAPTCQHGAEVVPATIWDPFAGSGTTNRVARELGRRSIYTDLSPVYADMAIRLMAGVTPTLPGLVPVATERQAGLW